MPTWARRSYERFLWAVGTVRARTHAPLDAAAIALVPLADLVRIAAPCAARRWRPDMPAMCSALTSDRRSSQVHSSLCAQSM
jgi:hypothetical protein